MLDTYVLREHLIKNNYIVVVTIIPNGCKVSYPERKLAPAQEAVCETFVVDGASQDTILYSNNGGSRTVKIPSYMSRLFIFSKITNFLAQKLNYDLSLIVVRDEYEKEIGDYKRLLDLLEGPLDEADMVKEKELIPIYFAASLYRFSSSLESDAKSRNVLDGYLLLYQVFKGEL
jgi:hypothetical protein